MNPKLRQQPKAIQTMVQGNQQILTTCPYCGVGCGIAANQETENFATVKGDPDHPANFGKLCSKGSTVGQTLSKETRLLHPSINGLRATMDQAIHYVADQFKQIIQQHGPDAVAFYVSGQLLTEDYYVANKLMKGFIGSGNIDTNSRLCMSSAVVAYKRAFGEDAVPGSYNDLEMADLLILAGSNAAWCHPILFQRIKAAKIKNPNMKVVVIDPRETASCEIADLHLALKPGTDITLFNGLLAYLHQNQLTDSHYIDQYCDGFNQALKHALADSPNIETVASHCGIAPEKVTDFFHWFGATEKTVTCFSQGINQSHQGSDKGNAIINCHLATGRVGKPGATPFSLTGQPNAMGGREVGGLANQLAAHMEFHEQDIATVEDFWQAPNMTKGPGLKAVDLFQAIEQGKVKAVWIMGTNPIVSLPNTNQVARALKKAQLVVASDCVADTDTNSLAHVLLPATGWGEKNGTVTNSERRISRQHNLHKPSGEALSDWRILTQFAHEMGWSDQFNYEHPGDVFREHAALTQFNKGHKQFNIASLAHLSDDEYDRLPPTQWPIENNQGTERLFADGIFSTPNRKAQFIAVRDQGIANPTSQQWPLALNTGRVRDQWHTMTRTALAPPLNAHKPEPYVEINPETAAAYGITKDDYVAISSQWGEVTLKPDITSSIQPGQLFVPIHWNKQWAQSANIGLLVNPVTDPISGQPESKHTPCNIQPWQPDWCGFLLSRYELPLPQCHYASKILGQSFYRYELAGQFEPHNEHGKPWATLQQSLTQWGSSNLSDEQGAKLQLQTYQDPARNSYRYAWVDNQGIVACLYLGSNKAKSILEADRAWIASLFQQQEIGPLDRKALLSGRSPAGVEDCGRIVCACFGVGEKTIINAIKEHKLTDAAQVGKLLKAGTNCGSCVSEIKALI